MNDALLMLWYALHEACLRRPSYRIGHSSQYACETGCREYTHSTWKFL